MRKAIGKLPQSSILLSKPYSSSIRLHAKITEEDYDLLVSVGILTFKSVANLVPRGKIETPLWNKLANQKDLNRP